MPAEPQREDPRRNDQLVRELTGEFEELTGDFERLTRAFNNVSAVLGDDSKTPRRLRHRVEKIEAEFDAIYHGDPLRTDFDNGVCRGLALSLAAFRRTTVEVEVQRSLQRLATKEGAQEQETREAIAVLSGEARPGRCILASRAEALDRVQELIAPGDGPRVDPPLPSREQWDRIVPMVDARCSYHHIRMGEDCTTKDAYRLVGSCANCNSQIVGLFTVGHEANSGWNSPECPICQCKGKLYWKGLEDTAASESTS